HKGGVEPAWGMLAECGRARKDCTRAWGADMATPESAVQSPEALPQKAVISIGSGEGKALDTAERAVRRAGSLSRHHDPRSISGVECACGRLAAGITLWRKERGSGWFLTDSGSNVAEEPPGGPIPRLSGPSEPH
ncbi:hypothetical protein FRC12_019355, partial [Ceratobasidium sp. 428]